jgi:hypothetical protein
MQIINSADPQEFGPVVYGHWCGSDAPAIVRRLAQRMKDRGSDTQYASARLVQETIAAGSDDSLGVGMWNAEATLTLEDSHGDAGCILIDCAKRFHCHCIGGYLKTGKDGFPMVPKD